MMPKKATAAKAASQKKSNKRKNENEEDEHGTDDEIVVERNGQQLTRKDLQNLNVDSLKVYKSREDNCKFYVDEVNKNNIYNDSVTVSAILIDFTI